MRVRAGTWVTGFAIVIFDPWSDGRAVGGDKSLATQLFRRGATWSTRGAFREGCRKLEESQRLDPGGGTLLNVALCHEKEGRTATAWAEFTEASASPRKTTARSASSSPSRTSPQSSRHCPTW
jgi:hypothetical protein